MTFSMGETSCWNMHKRLPPPSLQSSPFRIYVCAWWWWSPRISSNWLMIAFITCNSNLVPLLEGLCSFKWSESSTLSVGSNCSNPTRFEVSAFYTHLLVLFVRKKRYIKTKTNQKGVSPDFIPQPRIYTLHMFFEHIYDLHIIIALVNLDSLWHSRCLIPIVATPGFTSEYPTCSVCVCVCIHRHIHTRILQLPIKIGKIQI